MQVTIVDISDPKNHENKQWSDGIVFFSDEWLLRKRQCMNFIKSQNKVFDRKIHGRKCIVKEIQNELGKEFLSKNHI